jgi:CheY-like chemotaxis protein
MVTLMDKHDMTTRVLLVDDDCVLRTILSSLLSVSGFQVTTAASVNEALKLICSETYDVLLSDLHMPGAGDGLTVISAMRHANPRAVTLLLSAYPQLAAATQAIVLQADEILTKPIDMTSLIDIIRQRTAAGPAGARETLSVSEILSRNTETIMRLWFEYLQGEEKVSSIPLSYEQSCAHLPQLFRELVCRLQSTQVIGSHKKLSTAAVLHGKKRYQQGYSAAMLVEESRMLQVSIFQMLQDNLTNIDLSRMLMGVMVIADEIDSQLSQAMTSFMECSMADALRSARQGLNQQLQATQ